MVRRCGSVLDAMRRYAEHSGHTLSLDTRSIFADGEHRMAIHVANAQRPGIAYRTRIDVFHFADGRIGEYEPALPSST